MATPEGSRGLQRLAGRNALITGAGGDIGRAMAARFIAEGARVACADIDPDAAQTRRPRHRSG